MARFLIFKKFITPLMVLGFILAGLSLRGDAQAQNNGVTATISELSGQVMVINSQGRSVEAEEDMDLAEGDQIVTKADGTAEISFDDETSVQVTENSSLIIQKMGLAPDTGVKHISLNLVLGRLFSVVKKALEGGHEMDVNTPDGVAAVKGTEFGVSVENGQSQVGVYDGLVAVSGRANDGKVTEPVMVKPNQETSVIKGMRPLFAKALSRRWLVHRARIAALRKNVYFLRTIKQRGEIAKFRTISRLQWKENKGKLSPVEMKQLQELKQKNPHLLRKHRRRPFRPTER